MTKQPMDPQVGNGVTLIMYSDWQAHTVTYRKGNTIRSQRDKVRLLNGPNSGEADALVVSSGGFAAHTSGIQRYAYQSDTSGPEFTWTLRKNGQWIRKGDPMNGSTRVVAGRYEHYDYNF